MPEFESWNQYSEFAYFVMRKARHILDAKNQRFLEAVVETSAKRKRTVEKGAVLWRAVLDHTWRVETVTDDDGNEIDSFDVPDTASAERMVPLLDRASEGRVNPKGIPCLYFSTDMNTAMTEVRPWIGSYVTVSQFVILRDLVVVDCSADSHGDVFSYFDNKDEPKREESVWNKINRAFSEPVTRTENVADYAPTQVLSEVFHSSGFDGIIYGSKLGSGKTLAVFDTTAAELASRQLCQVEDVSLKFKMMGNPYIVSKYVK
jgi:RES domain-containing protein